MEPPIIAAIVTASISTFVALLVFAGTQILAIKRDYSALHKQKLELLYRSLQTLKMEANVAKYSLEPSDANLKVIAQKFGFAMDEYLSQIDILTELYFTCLRPKVEGVRSATAEYHSLCDKHADGEDLTKQLSQAKKNLEKKITDLQSYLQNNVTLLTKSYC